MTSETFGKRLRKVRGKRTLASFAASIDVDAGTIHNYETGKHWPGSRFLIRLRKVHNVDLNKLLVDRGPE